MKFSLHRVCSFLAIALSVSALLSSCVDGLKKDLESIKEEMRIQRAALESLKENVAITGVVYDSTSGLYELSLSNGEVIYISGLSLLSVDESDDCWSFTFIDGKVVSCQKKVKVAQLLSFCFKSSENPRALIDDVDCTVSGGEVNGVIPFTTEDKKLIPSFQYTGTDIIVDGISMSEVRCQVDFKKPLNVDVIGFEGDTASYVVSLISFTGLPAMYITTRFGSLIDVGLAADQGCSIRLVEDIYTKSSGDITVFSGSIRGLYSPEWTLDKKPYFLSFYVNNDLLGMPSGTYWSLFALHCDKTLLRSKIVYQLSSDYSNLRYTSRSRYIELFLNGSFLGTYLLCEYPKVQINRMDPNVAEYFLSIGGYYPTKPFFNVEHLEKSVRIMEPLIETGSYSFNKVKTLVNAFDSVLFCENFKDPQTGYASYIDVDSFVDWYLVNEISKNKGSDFTSDCFMTYNYGGKLAMGPVKGSDASFGNDTASFSSPEGLYVGETSWYKRLFEDSAFVSKVKVRFNDYYSDIDRIYPIINEYASFLKYSVIENNYKWNVLSNNAVSNDVMMSRYGNEVTSMKFWIAERMEWLKEYFSDL